jgi:hypothetical protein
MYLRTTKRKNRDSGIEAHMKICVLTLLIQRMVEQTDMGRAISIGCLQCEHHLAGTVEG